MSADAGSPLLSRRGALLAAGALAATFASPAARAHGRVRPGGGLSVHVPWSLATVDPHRLDDGAAMFFGACLFDGLYAFDPSGAVVPALAEALPEATPEGLRVTLRKGVRFASGKAVTDRDVVRALARARSLGARGWLDAAGPVRGGRGVGGAGSLLFGGKSSEHAARALASPLAAIVPEAFAPERPDGTGPFAAAPLAREGDARVLTRNRFAVSGPAYLDRLAIAPAEDLAASLRAFESGEDDLGWLGLGLHEPRRGAVPFDAGALGWAVLRTGDQVGRWNVPGVAQRMADGLDPSRLAHLGVRADWTLEPADGWGGPPVSLLVRADSAWLVELARAVAAALSAPDHVVTAHPLPPGELAAALASRAYGLAVDLVRPYDPTPLGTYGGLVAADDQGRAVDLITRPPLGAAAIAPRAAGRVLRLGVLSAVRLAGGRMPDLALPPGPGGVGVDFGSIIHPHPRVL